MRHISPPRRAKKRKKNPRILRRDAAQSGRTFFLPLSPSGRRIRDLRSPPSSSPTQPRCYTRRPATIFERCLSGLDQIYSYEFQKALDSSPKRSLLAAAAPRNAAPKIRVLAVGLLVDAFVRSFGCCDILGDVPEPTRPGIAMAPIPSRQEVPSLWEER